MSEGVFIFIMNSSDRDDANRLVHLIYASHSYREHNRLGLSGKMYNGAEFSYGEQNTRICTLFLVIQGAQEVALSVRSSICDMWILYSILLHSL